MPHHWEQQAAEPLLLKHRGHTLPRARHRPPLIPPTGTIPNPVPIPVPIPRPLPRLLAAIMRLVPNPLIPGWRRGLATACFQRPACSEPPHRTPQPPRGLGGKILMVSAKKPWGSE